MRGRDTRGAGIPVPAAPSSIDASWTGRDRRTVQACVPLPQTGGMTPKEAPAPARAVVLVILLMNVAWAVVLPVMLVDPGGATAWLVVLVVLALHATAHVLVMRAAVSPWVEGRARSLHAGVLVGTSILAWPALSGWAEPGQEPWAWLVGFTIGALPLVMRWSTAGLVSLGLVGLVALEAALRGASAGQAVVFVAVAASAAGVFAMVVVWMLRLLVAAEAGRAAEAGLAVAEERLRFSRELHDALGHRLHVIALRAELAGADDIRELASAAARDVRGAVHGYAALDLAEQVRGAELVLGSAGVEIEVELDSSDLTGLAAPISQLLATAVREGVTNILRHSDARACRIVISEQHGLLRLVMSNDRPRSPADVPGLGLTGLHERAGALGARVRTTREDDLFVLCVEVPR